MASIVNSSSSGTVMLNLQIENINLKLNNCIQLQEADPKSYKHVLIKQFMDATTQLMPEILQLCSIIINLIKLVGKYKLLSEA